MHTHKHTPTHTQVADVGRAMELGREAANFVSAKFVHPVKLEFEKVGLGIHKATCRRW